MQPWHSKEKLFCPSLSWRHFCFAPVQARRRKKILRNRLKKRFVMRSALLTSCLRQTRKIGPPRSLHSRFHADLSGRRPTGKMSASRLKARTARRLNPFSRIISLPGKSPHRLSANKPERFTLNPTKVWWRDTTRRCSKFHLYAPPNILFRSFQRQMIWLLWALLYK